MSLAFVFPGQGSLRADALSAWEGHEATAVLDEVSAGVGRDVAALAADPQAGARTADAQPAILAASLVAWRAATAAGLRPDVVAGHSLGEITAAVAAGALSVRDGARLVAARGAAMGEACRQHPGTMAALVRLDPEQVERLVAEVDDVVVANDNAPGQVVVAGTPAGVERISERAREEGGRVLSIEVEGAFHSPAMESAVAPVAETLAAIEVRDPEVPLVSGVTASPVREGVAIEAALVDGIRSPVRWREVQSTLADLGATALLELGPGGVLKGLARRTVPDLEVRTVAGPDDLDTAVADLRGHGAHDVAPAASTDTRSRA